MEIVRDGFMVGNLFLLHCKEIC